jgi:hypothetical protein
LPLDPHFIVWAIRLFHFFILKAGNSKHGEREESLGGLSESGHFTEAPQGQARPLSDVPSRLFFHSNLESLFWVYPGGAKLL